MGDRNTILEVENLKKYFPVRSFLGGVTGWTVKAVDGIGFSINKGETFGLIGESGCGKTTVGKMLNRIYEPTSGNVIFKGENVTKINTKHLRKKIQMIFQDPYASLDPRMTIGDIIGEPFEIYGLEKGDSRKEKIYSLLDMVGMKKEHANRYPHEFSGGQRQRIGIARALAVGPEFIVCDEPISALDVSIQAQIVNMLEDLQKTFNLTYLFIAHDLSMVRHISNRTGVMYLGKLVETADSGELYEKPAHPYTHALISAIPGADPVKNAGEGRLLIDGEIPSPINPPSGCRFRTRCGCSMKICAEKEPEYIEISTGHMCACNLYCN